MRDPEDLGEAGLVTMRSLAAARFLGACLLLAAGTWLLAGTTAWPHVAASARHCAVSCLQWIRRILSAF